MMTDRPCTCHPDDNPPVPCPQRYALSECRKAAQQEPPQQSEELPPLGHPLHTLGERLTHWLDDDQWNNAEPLLLEAYSLCSKDSPQQSAEPVAVVPANIGDQSGCIRWLIDEQLPVGTLLYTAPPVQSAEPDGYIDSYGIHYPQRVPGLELRPFWYSAPPVDPAKQERARKLVELLETISARLEDEGGYVYSQKEGAPHLRIREAAALLKEAHGL